MTDVTNTTRIHALLVNRRWISPEHRARLLSDAAKAAAEKTG
ncbi:hypothetical protein [Nonomuraea insulae]|uniref:Uncharacterized protein n=1 Tax=Nonomuraea insulae TaxID=1616787 RepID=A0ABW1CQI1_9ACTN